MHTLQGHLKDGRLVVFVGAGVSMLPPTCLPSWWDVNRAVVTALVEQVSRIFPTNAARSLGETVTARQKAGRLPPEYQAEIIAGRLPRGYFDVLRCLDSDQPNAAHDHLVALARTGRLRAIVTTNFDRVIESAFQQAAVPLVVCARPDAFAQLAARLPDTFKSGEPCHLLKLHGSAEDPETVIDTLAQRKQGLPRATQAVLRHLLQTAYWLFLGYSGADLEAEPNYLGLREGADHSPGFAWLVRTGARPLSAVLELASRYGERAVVAEGELPGWLEFLTSGLDVQRRPTGNATALQSAAAARIQQHTRAWGESHGPVWCGLVLSDLLQAVGVPSASRELLTALHDRLAEAKQDIRLRSAVSMNLATVHEQAGELEDAQRLYEEALHGWDELGDLLGRGLVLNNLAVVQDQQGAREQARQSWQEALQVWDRLDNRHQRANTLQNLAVNARGVGRWDEAVRLLEEVQRLAAELGREPLRARALVELGNSHHRAGQLDESERAYREAAAIQDRLGDDAGAAAAAVGLGLVHTARDEDGPALQQFGRALGIYRRLNQPLMIAMTLDNLGVQHERQERDESARRCYAECLALAERAGLPHAAARARMGLARLANYAGDRPTAHMLADAALHLFRQLGSPQAMEAEQFLTELDGKSP